MNRILFVLVAIALIGCKPPANSPNSNKDPSIGQPSNPTSPALPTTENFPPVTSLLSSYSAAEGEQIVINTAAFDPENHSIEVTCHTCPADSLIINNHFVWTPNFSSSGVHNIVLDFSDGENLLTETFSISVANTNRPPSFEPISSRTIAENTTLNILVQAFDPDGDNVLITANALPANATFNVNTLSFTPNSSQSGMYNFTFTATDGISIITTTFNVAVSNSNQAPVLSVPVTQAAQEAHTFNMTISAIDPDNDVLTFTATNLPSGAAFNAATKTLSWYPTCVQEGVYTISFTVSDGNLSDTRSTTITVAREPSCFLPTWNTSPFNAIAPDTMRMSLHYGTGIDADGPVTYGYVAQYSCSPISQVGYWGVESYPNEPSIFIVNYTSNQVEDRFFKVFVRDSDGNHRYRILKVMKRYSNNLTFELLTITNSNSLCGGAAVYSYTGTGL